MQIDWCVVSPWLAALVVVLVVVRRTRTVRSAIAASNAKPTTAMHQIRAFTLAGEPLPDFYLGDDDRAVARKWRALKEKKTAGHWELWHARHGKRDSITRGAV